MLWFVCNIQYMRTFINGNVLGEMLCNLHTPSDHIVPLLELLSSMHSFDDFVRYVGILSVMKPNCC